MKVAMRLGCNCCTLILKVCAAHSFPVDYLFSGSSLILRCWDYGKWKVDHYKLLVLANYLPMNQRPHWPQIPFQLLYLLDIVSLFLDSTLLLYLPALHLREDHL